eukprot:GFYU01004665.1.p1 GENE.GFYU01004665.1~~GFYU01004665.1.p1  ORF type:complete len:302 (-),score=44.09 GFYU01004665.1:304-1209(-)
MPANGRSSISYTLGFVPVALVIAIVFWCVFILMFFVTLPEMQEGNAVGYILNLLLILLLVPFFMAMLRVISTDPGKVPSWYGEDEGTASSGAQAQILAGNRLPQEVESKRDGSRRFCRKCDQWKPDRTHHCSSCRRCVLKMDHHCPWINNCVGFRNYKYFFIFVTYALLLAVFCWGALYTKFMSTWHGLGGAAITNEEIFVMATFISLSALCLCLFGFWGFHYVLLTNNSTTIEWLEKRSEAIGEYHNFYDLGASQNVRTVMGDKVLHWVWPIGDPQKHDLGVYFETNFGTSPDSIRDKFV